MGLLLYYGIQLSYIFETLIFQMEKLVFQAKYLVCRSKTLDFDRNTRYFKSEFFTCQVFHLLNLKYYYFKRILSISETWYFDSKAGTEKIVMTRGFCFFQMFWTITKRWNAGSKSSKHFEKILKVLLEVVNGEDRSLSLSFFILKIYTTQSGESLLNQNKHYIMPLGPSVFAADHAA